MKQFFTLFVITVLSSSVSWACSCFGESNFCSSITSEFSSPPDLIVSAKKVEDYYYGMQVEVIEVIQGETDRDTLVVWGDNGALCRVNTSQFEIGQTLILALQDTDFSGNIITTGFPPDLEGEGDYQLSVCGIYFLSLDNGIVNGQIDTETNQMTYEDFKDVACLVSGIPPVPEIIVELIPNPADSKIDLYFWNSQPYPLTFKVFDAIGRLVIATAPQEMSIQKTIDISYLENGVYVLYVENEEQFSSLRFVVTR
ncbi:MAG: T9SS type A sorting domain-containing protein [Bacteroidota bacterium]